MFQEPAVIMAIVGIFKLAVTSSKLGLTKEEMANKALPFLIPLSIENGLTVAQFTIIVNLIKEMIQKVETEHRTKLEQLHAIQDSQKSSLQVSLSENMTLGPGRLVSAPSPADVSSMDTMYSGLGLGDYVNSDKSKLVNSVIGSDGRQKENNMPNIPKSSSTLSLQEKKQMMQKQETVQESGASPSPVNLTDSLMNKSISMNAMSGLKTNNSSWNSKPSAGQTNWNTNSSTLNAPTWNSSNTGGGFTQQPAQQGFGNFASASLSISSSASGMMQPKPTQSKPDLSAFDSLMSPSSFATPKPSMGSMIQKQTMGVMSPAPLLPQQSSGAPGNNNSSKQLSLNDINDLLS